MKWKTTKKRREKKKAQEKKWRERRCGWMGEDGGGGKRGEWIEI